MDELTYEQRDDIELAVQKLTSRYDSLFQCLFPALCTVFEQGVDIEHW